VDAMEPKTKNLSALLKAVSAGKATLFVTGAPLKNLCLAARNIPDTEVTTAAQANTYQIARHAVVIADAAGLDILAKRLGAE
ncbi:MAG: 50S ribosomal protein L4, partial [Kiritimatiellae bacterium]|nr:50S ribosomal protein L4 [Kiritimatiellia bacterium]